MSAPNPDGWTAENALLMQRAASTRCPDCGQRATVTHEPWLGAMVTCSCGARSTPHEWVKGIVSLRRNPDGTYSPVRVK